MSYRETFKTFKFFAVHKGYFSFVFFTQLGGSFDWSVPKNLNQSSDESEQSEDENEDEKVGGLFFLEPFIFRNLYFSGK